jgi:hypothetical protein
MGLRVCASLPSKGPGILVALENYIYSITFGTDSALIYIFTSETAKYRLTFQILVFF